MGGVSASPLISSYANNNYCLKKKVDSARKGIDGITSKIIKDNEVEILDYIRKGQLALGVDSEGKTIQAGGAYDGVYSRTYGLQVLGGWGDNSTPKTTKTKGQPYNFTWSGYTMSNFRLDYSNFNLFINNVGNSAEYLTSFYNNGEKLFSMSDENQLKMRQEKIIPGLTNYLKSIFG